MFLIHSNKIFAKLFCCRMTTRIIQPHSSVAICKRDVCMSHQAKNKSGEESTSIVCIDCFHDTSDIVSHKVKNSSIVVYRVFSLHFSLKLGMEGHQSEAKCQINIVQSAYMPTWGNQKQGDFCVRGLLFVKQHKFFPQDLIQMELY